MGSFIQRIHARINHTTVLAAIAALVIGLLIGTFALGSDSDDDSSVAQVAQETQQPQEAPATDNTDEAAPPPPPYNPDNTRICWIAHGTEADLFWATARGVAISAGWRDLGFLKTSFYLPDEVGKTQSQQIRECVDSDLYDVIATTIPDPDGMRDAIAYARDNGIVVTSFNSGVEHAAELGSALHVALDDRESGVQLGQRFADAALGGRVLCVLHEERNVGLTERCEGIAESYGGEVEQFAAHATGVANPQATIDAIEAELDEGGYGAVVVLNQLLAEGLAGIERGVVKASYLTEGSALPLLATGDLDYLIHDHAGVQGITSMTNAFIAMWLSPVIDVFQSPPIILQIAPLILDRDNVPQYYPEVLGTAGQ